eukprot:PLAT6452.2.p1 GENE.PLAT6452.2~~PLAT6452.2.p1  ORF type:complete len:1197 (+),score=723.54 PLAT6452.2:25-3591(+)
MAASDGIDESKVELEMADMGAASDRFSLTAAQLAAPDPSVGLDSYVFDWQNDEWSLEEFGGVRGVAEKIGSDLVAGLSSTEDFAERERVFGSNATEEAEPATYWDLIWEGLHDFTLVLLIVAAVVSIVLGIITEGPEEGWYEGVAILLAVVLVLNVAAINDLQKDKQFRDVNRINNMKPIRVIRDGKKTEILIQQLQVGDLVALSGQDGDVVPADCLFVETTGSPVKIDESMLTGESVEVTKNESKPFVVSGSLVKEGACTVVVVAVGPWTVQGRAAALMEGGEETPLQLKLEKLATQVSKLGFVVAVICVIVMLITHLVTYFGGQGTVNEAGEPEWATSNWNAIVGFIIVAVTVLVVAIPEGLPLAVTISLAYSVKKMMRDKNLVRHLAACETMGGANTICSDKTGTLTQNRMKVCQAWVARGEDLSFLGEMKKGDKAEETAFQQAVKELPDGLRVPLLYNGIINSTAFLRLPGEDEADEAADKEADKGAEEEKEDDADAGEPRVVGSKTEGAFLLLAHELGLDIGDVRGEFPVVREFSFTSKRKRSGAVVLLDEETQRFRLYVKGASEMVLRLCDKMLDADGNELPLEGDFSLDGEGAVEGDGMKADIVRNVINPMANAALRTIALAYRDFDGEQDWGQLVTWPAEDSKGAGECPLWEDELTLVGVVGIKDPLRHEVPEAVKTCQKAGITVRMVTGDNIATAKAIAKECNLFHPEGWVDPYGKRHAPGRALEGPDFREMAGGLVLPPHFFHECKCEDLSGSDFFVDDYVSPAGWPSIVGHRTEACEQWSPEAVARRGADKCTDECKLRGCYKQLNKKRHVTEERFKVVKNQAKFDDIWPTLEVLARSAPTDKHLLVTGLIERGQVVAVTGDGTNDGPALSRADVGFAMGSGTQVAKEASDIVLLDDNFNSIVAAVSWGRNVYDSIRKFLQFQLTVNVVALFVAFIGSVILKESPLRAVQLLWVNLIMDTFASLALATEPPTPALLDKPPYGRHDSLINRIMLRNILAHSLFQSIVLCSIVWWGEAIFQLPPGRNLGHAAEPTEHYTIVFNVFVMMQVFNEINCRMVNDEANVFRGIMNNMLFVVIVIGTFVVQILLVQGGGVFMSVTPLNFEQHLVCILIGSLALPLSSVVRLTVRADLFGEVKTEEISEEERAAWGSFTRRNSQQSLPSVLTKRPSLKGSSLVKE